MRTAAYDLHLSSSEGFNRVFPMEKLSSFSHKEVQMILCGNQSPSWTADDVINYTEPKLGYTRDRFVHKTSILFPLSSCIFVNAIQPPRYSIDFK